MIRLWLSLITIILITTSNVTGQGLRRSSSTMPSVAFVQIAFNKVSKVDGVEQLFSADFYMQTTWFDLDRQATWANYFNTDEGRLPPTNAAGNFEFSPHFEGWYDPQIEFVNTATEPATTGTYYIITTPDFVSDQHLLALNMTSFTGANRGNLYWMMQDYRYITEFTTPLDLKSFPFDEQFVQIAMESKWAGNDKLTIYYANPDAIDKIKLNEDQSPIVGWKIIGSQQLRTEHTYAALTSTSVYSRLVVGLKVRREPNYYIMKICLGVILLVFMCIWVFSLAVDEADRMMGTLQVFSGLITFLFVASADVPKVPYQTRLDSFMNFSFFIVAIIMFVHGGLYYFRESDQDEEEDAENKKKGTKVAPTAVNNNFTEPTDADEQKSPRTHNVYHKHRDNKGNIFHRWWSGLVWTRKNDVLWIPLLAITYTIGTAIILGRSTPSATDIYAGEGMPPTFI
jgi:hypothetical protein